VAAAQQWSGVAWVTADATGRGRHDAPRASGEATVVALRPEES